MKNKILCVLVGCLISYNVYAKTSVSITFNGKNKSEVKTNEVTLYNFSDDLLNAVKHCSPYQEDFIKHNPNLKNMGFMFGGADFQVLIDIKGFTNEMCDFVITQKFVGVGGTENICSVDKEALAKILDAMNDKSSNLITQTFTTKSKMIDENGQVLELDEVENKVTGSAFDIMLTKVMGNNCYTKEIEPTQEETDYAKAKMLAFSDKFINSLKSCTPDKEVKSMFFVTKYAEIIGKKQGLCHVQNADFNFYISEDKISEITGFDKLYNLVTDNNIAKYRASEHYSLSLILPMIQKCSNSRFRSQGGGSMESYDKIKIKYGVSSEYNKGICALRIANELIIDEKTKDYSIQCNISDETRDMITSKYTILDNEEEDKKIGKQILAFLIKNKICAKANN